jgi:hypothetical protein
VKLLKYIAFFTFLIGSGILLGQQPKMHIKAYAGYHDHHFVTKGVTDIEDNIRGYLLGFGFRVAKNRWYGEIDFEIARSGYILQNDSLFGDNIFEFKFISFQLPITGGYILIKEPVFKWYVYSGPVQRFNTKGVVRVEDLEDKFKPKDVGLRGYNLDWRFGTQFDVAMFNFDIRYTFGVTNSFDDNRRSNSHILEITAGMIF